MLLTMKSKVISVLFALILSATGSPAEHHHALQRRNFPLPLPSCTPYTPWHYVGCFIEEDPTFLVYNTELTFETMTIEICIDSCKANGYKYAGLEYHGKCFCGTVLSTQVDDADCQTAACSGDPTEWCGGTTARISVYEDPTYPAHTYMPGDYTYEGCYTEPGTYRAVTWFQGQLNPGTLTTEECLAACGAQHFAYAATEWSQECYCATYLNSGSSLATNQGDCNYPCTGDSSETCGGSERLSLYYAPIFQSTQPCGYTPPSTGPQCGTAYGYVTGDSTTFISLNIGSNWGWVVQGTLPISGTLYMGGGQNDITKATTVGSFTIALVGSSVVITYTTVAPYAISEDHFFYGATYPSHISPGKFGHTHSFTTPVTTDTFTVPFVSGDNTYIIHAAIVNPSATIPCSS